MASHTIRAIVGLGNPGPRYFETRHNAGFWFADALAGGLGGTFREDNKLEGELATVGTGEDKLFLFKPLSFMNRSGGPVGALLRYYRIAPEEILVAYDELDLPPGTARLKSGGGHGGHNGMRDLFQHLPSTDFLRLRIGIGHPGHKDAVVGYVLSRPPREEEEQIRASIDAAVDVMPKVLAGELEKAMTQLHSRQ